MADRRRHAGREPLRRVLLAATVASLAAFGGQHRVSGLVRRRRSGRSVLCYRTDLGEILARARPTPGGA